jgi:hypothetical protein
MVTRTALAFLLAAACGACSSVSSGSSAAASSGAAGASSGADSDAATGDVGCANEVALDVYAPGLHRLGDAGRYDFSLLSSEPAPPALNDNTFTVRVSDQDGAALNGVLGVVLDMPEHGHSSPKQPTITFNAKAQAFTLAPMDLFMVGLWRFTFTFTPSIDEGAAGAAGAAPAAEPSDSAVFKLCIE